jgi:hypothetical protein
MIPTLNNTDIGYNFQSLFWKKLLKEITRRKGVCFRDLSSTICVNFEETNLRTNHLE